MLVEYMMVFKILNSLMKERKRGNGRNSFIIFEGKFLLQQLVKHKYMKFANILILGGLEYGSICIKIKRCKNIYIYFI